MRYDFASIEAFPDRFKAELKTDLTKIVTGILEGGDHAALIISELGLPARRMYLDMLIRAFSENVAEEAQRMLAVEALRASLKS